MHSLSTEFTGSNSSNERGISSFMHQQVLSLVAQLFSFLQNGHIFEFMIYSFARRDCKRRATNSPLVSLMEWEKVAHP